MRAGFILARAYNVITRTGLPLRPARARADRWREGMHPGKSLYFTTRDECRTAADAIREVAESADFRSVGD